MPPLQIRLLQTHGEFRQCERLQRDVWGAPGASSEVMLVTQKYGGVVLGAFAGRRLVGFLYALLARRRRRLIHWSHMMAVDARHRDRGLGFRLKLEHRRLALAEGIRSVCWTFDPLQSRNAALNLTRLGARPEEYVTNCYGRFPSTIERGLESDRFVVNWRIGSAAVARRLREGPPEREISRLPRVNPTRLDSRGLLENRRIDLGLKARRLLVEIPAHTDRMRAESPALAGRWRKEARRIFQHYLGARYRVEDFLPPAAATEGRCFYLLRRSSSRRPSGRQRIPEPAMKP